jgi:hypothetical protein
VFRIVDPNTRKMQPHNSILKGEVIRRAKKKMTRMQQEQSSLFDAPVEGVNVYFDVVGNHCGFLSRCLVVNGRLDLEANREYISNVWDKSYKIVQFWDGKELPDDVYELVEGWKNAVPNGNHVLFDDSTSRNFIRAHYNNSFVDAYDYCWHPAMKSDYFRLAYLYVNGGLYVDADEKLLYNVPNVNFAKGNLLVIFPLMRERNENGEFTRVTIRDLSSRTLTAHGPECYFANSPIFASRENEVLKLALARATNLIIEAKGNQSALDIHNTTGPTNLTLAIAAHLIQSSCAGKQPSSIKVIEWTRYAASMPLKYKDGDRNWRHVRSGDDFARRT